MCPAQATDKMIIDIILRLQADQKFQRERRCLNIADSQYVKKACTGLDLQWILNPTSSPRCQRHKLHDSDSPQTTTGKLPIGADGSSIEGGCIAFVGDAASEPHFEQVPEMTLITSG